MARAKVKVNIQNKQKTVTIPSGIRMLIRRCCQAVLHLENFPEEAEVDISFVDNATIRQINNETRHIDKVTDVLSFPLGENGVFDHNPENGHALLGDIVLSFEKAQEQAEEFGHSLDREVAYLTAHSMLHLLGYDHINGGKEAMIMREHEENVMAAIGLLRDNAHVLEK